MGGPAEGAAQHHHHRCHCQQYERPGDPVPLPLIQVPPLLLTALLSYEDLRPRASAEVPQDRIGDAPTGMTVSIGVHRMGHAVVGAVVPDQPLCHGDDIVLHHAGQLHRPSSYGLRSLCLPAQHQHGLAQRRRFLLQPARVRHDHVAPGHQVVHLIGRQRVDRWTRARPAGTCPPPPAPQARDGRDTPAPHPHSPPRSAAGPA